jgi:hypothetical protein
MISDAQWQQLRDAVDSICNRESDFERITVPAESKTEGAFQFPAVQAQRWPTTNSWGIAIFIGASHLSGAGWDLEPEGEE